MIVNLEIFITLFVLLVLVSDWYYRFVSIVIGLNIIVRIDS